MNRQNDEEVELYAGIVAAATKAEKEVSHFLRGLFLSMKDCAGKKIAHTQASVNIHGFMVVSIYRSEVKDSHDIVLGQSVVDNSALDASRIIPSSDVLLLPWINATSNDHPSAVREFEKV